MPGTSSSTSWPAHAGAPPLFATPRNPDAPNDGAAIAVVARSLGTPLLPWQQYVADVASERRPDGSYEYQTVVVSVPRQSGKTTLIWANGVHLAAVLGKDMHYTAQTGKDARERWTKLNNDLKTSEVWGHRVDESLRGGAETVFFHGKAGPGVHCFAPGKKALHGSTPANVTLDEAFAHDPEMGAALMGAIKPAQQTILAKQVWLVSTMGTAESTFFHKWVERAQQGSPRVALFLWAAREDADVYSAKGVESYHPGVGFKLNEKVLSAQDILDEQENVTPSEYVRAFGNLRTLTQDNLIPVDVWVELGDAHLAPPSDTRDVTLSYDVAADRRSAAIVATWNLPDGRVAGKVVQSSPGSSWLAPAVGGLAKAWRPAAIATVGHGPVLDTTAQLRDLGHEITELDTTTWAAASSTILGRIEDKRLVHDGGPTLAASATGLAGRPDDRGGIVLSRRRSAGDSSAGFALAAGVWVTERRANTGKPAIHF